MKLRNELDPRRFSSARPPVMLLGGLNVTRALGLAGIPVIVASSDAHSTALTSRYCSGWLPLPSLEQRGAAVLEALLRAGERLAGGLGRRLPLFYGNDDWQRLVQEHRTDLARHYELLLNDSEVAEAVIEKDLFQPLAVRRGLAIPRTLEREELEAFRQPVLVKPRSKCGWDDSAVYVRLFGRQGKARIFANGRALLADAAAQELREQLVIQEYVGGGDRDLWSFHGFSDENSRLLNWFIGRKIRTHPVLTGCSAYLELAHHEELAALGREIAAALPLKGVFKIDLKRDPRLGRFRVLEVNARYNLWHYLGAANGVNLPLTAYEYLVYGKRPAAASPYRTTQRWIYLRLDWHAYRELASSGELGFAGWLLSLAAAPKVCQLFAWSDPLPFLRKLHRTVKSRLPRLTAVLRRWLATVS
jgi:D-aspartate ligase